jgi:hypothetical protein
MGILMASFARKVLWIVTMNEAAESRLLDHARASGANAVCIRTDNKRLPDAIGRFKQGGFKTYAWRWPAVKPQPNSTTHYYAKDEAQYVVDKLIPAGLDGYIMDPESESDSPRNDWNSTSLKPLAEFFCKTIRDGATAAGLANFAFGVTSGCDYATSRKKMPWDVFAATSDALFPQTYWRWTNGKGKVQNINGGTPDKAADKGLTSWRHIANGKPIILMAGETDVIKVDEIPLYAARVRQEGLDQYHFYADNASVSQEKCTAIKAI